MGVHTRLRGQTADDDAVKGSTCGTDCRGSANNCAQCVRDPEVTKVAVSSQDRKQLQLGQELNTSGLFDG